MLFLFLAIIFLVLKYLEVGFLSTYSWWWVCLPLGLAIAWWSWSDASGRTKRLAMEKMDKRKDERLQKQRNALRGGVKRD